MDILRDDLVSDTDTSLDVEPSARERFLLDEGFEFLAIYRNIRDANLRRAARDLIAVIAASQTREQ